MGLNVGAVRLFLELKIRGQLDGLSSIAEIGSQELYLTLADFRQLVASAGLQEDLGGSFDGLEDPSQPPRPSARHFYQLLGIDEYVCLDVNGQHGAIQCDLNLPFNDRSLFGKFDIVTDHGSAEHVFNVAEVYRTMHNLCRQSGLIIAIQAVVNGNGYYCFDHTFFEGLAAANGYRVLYASYMITPDSLTAGGGNPEWHVPIDDDLLNSFDFSKLKALGIVYVMQKVADARFVVPYQDGMLAEKLGHRGYELQFLPTPPSRTYVPKVGDASARDVLRLIQRAPRSAYLRLKRRLRRKQLRSEEVLRREPTGQTAAADE